MLMVAQCWHVGGAFRFFTSSNDGLYLKEKRGGVEMWCCGLSFLLQALITDNLGSLVGEDTDSDITTVS